MAILAAVRAFAEARPPLVEVMDEFVAQDGAQAVIYARWQANYPEDGRLR